MSSEDEFDLNYVKLDSKNEIKLLGADDYAAEMSTFFFNLKKTSIVTIESLPA